MLHNILREQVRASDETRAKFAAQGIGPMIVSAVQDGINRGLGRRG